MLPEEVLAPQYAQVIASHLDMMGISVARWLALSGHSRDELHAPGFRLDYATFRILLLNGIQVAEEPALGLLIGERLGVEAHGVLGHAAMSSSSVREMLAVIERYLALRVSLVKMAIEPHPDEIRVRFTEQRHLGDVRSMFLEALLCTIKTVLDDVSLGACGIKRVSFPFPRPAHARLASSVLRAPVIYAQPWTGFSLPHHVLDAPLKLSEPETFRLAEALCRRQLEAIEAGQSWSDRVRRLLLNPRSGFPTQDDTAARLRVSRRTLHRHLQREGTNYRAIVESIRRELALHQLESGQASVAEVSYILGYSDPGNFRRAFKRWTGETPSLYRARLRAR